MEYFTAFRKEEGYHHALMWKKIPKHRTINIVYPYLFKKHYISICVYICIGNIWKSEFSNYQTSWEKVLNGLVLSA